MSQIYNRPQVDNSTVEYNGAVLRQKDGGTTAAKLASNAVTTVKILDGNVTTPKIADGNVTKEKLAASMIYDSGWIAVTPGSSTATLNHNLGTTKVLTSMYGATSGAGANMGRMISGAGAGGGAFYGITDTDISYSIDGNAVVETAPAPTFVAVTHIRIIMIALP